MNLHQAFENYGPVVVFLGAAFEGNLAVIAGGLLAHQKLVPLWVTGLAATCGSWLIDQALFMAGRRFREHRFVERVCKTKAFAKSLAFIERYPNSFILAFRFIYGVRMAGPVALGVTRVSATRFFILNFLGAAIWAATFTLAGFFRVAPALCVAVLFFSFFDAVVLSLLPVYASSHGFAVGVAALMVTVVFAGDMIFQLPLGWLADRVERTGLHLVCGVVAMSIGIGLPWLLQATWLLWPMLVLLGAVAGGIYTLALVLIGQRFKGQDLVTANASVGLLWGVGSLVGPLVSGAAMDVAPHGLPMALALMAGLFVCFARQSYRRAARLRAVTD